MAYLKNMPNANSGSGGHNATLQAALACRRFGLSGGEIWQAMTWFNENKCTPRWSERELRHKVDSVAELAVNKPLGPSRVSRHAGHIKPFTAPDLVEVKADARPVYQQSEQAEELWWARVASGLGTTLEQFDESCGNG